MVQPFKTTKELEEYARAEKFGLGAFNTNNLEITKSIVAALKEENSPAIIAVSPSAMKYAGAEYISSMVKVAAETEGIEVALHLDHGTTIEDCQTAIDNGFSSVMFDGSKHPLEENIELTKKVVDIAGPLGVSVEGELGRIFGTEDQIVVNEREASFTDPKEAVELVEKTGMDSLAVSIGNAHGFYKGKPELDFDRLAEIADATKDTDVLLVLHGASGIPDEDIRTAIDIGVSKINIDTEIRNAFKQGVTKFVEENPDVIDPRKILKPASDNMTA
ncbi:MAG TPA: ketose-bisphosphate aldolase, partial [Actinobacteria bacterium]|nr:ketose-bisphosphate aldolase [Actinomycetota bacterium]